MRNLLALAVATGLLAAVPVAAAQSLGDVAKQEQARRKSVAAPGKVYTNGSLRAEPAPSTPTSSSAAPTSPADGAAAPVPPAEGQKVTGGGTSAPAPDEPKKDEVYWRRRLDEARTALSRAQTFRDALQNQINSLTADFAARDDPAQRSKVGADRQKALAELDRLGKEIQQHQKSIADIQEEARRAGVPAGWVR